MIDLIPLHSAAQFVEKKFSAINIEIDAWIFDNVNKFPKYDKEGNLCEHRDYYDRNTIETFDFINDSSYPRLQRIPYNKVSGGTISGLEALVILRKNYSELSEQTISNSLGSINAYVSNKPDKNGFIILNWNLIAEHVNLYYSEEEVRKLIPKTESQFISFSDLMNREKWKKFKKLDVIKRLQTLNFEKRLKVFDPVNWMPGYMESTFIGRYGNGKERILSNWKHTSHYGMEAQSLINEEKAMFQLSEIEAIEKSEFTQIKQTGAPKSGSKEITLRLYEEVKKEILKGRQEPLTDRETMGALANRIYDLGKSRGLYGAHNNVNSASTVKSHLTHSGIKSVQVKKLVRL